MPKNKNKKRRQVTLSKWLYKFEINKTSVEKVTTSSKDKDGNEVSVTKEEEVTKPFECYILRPKRSLIDKAELFYGIQLAIGVKAGLLTKSLIHKRYSDDGGVFSDADKKEYSELQLRLLRSEKELQKLELSQPSTEEEKKVKNEKAAASLFAMTEIRSKMQDFESLREAVFDQTADSRAKNKVALWWILQLSYIKDELEGEEIVPLFKGNDHEEKLTSYDRYEELNIEHINDAMQHFAYFISFWHNGQANTKEEFDRVKVFLDIDLDSRKDDEEGLEEGLEDKVSETEEAIKEIEEKEKEEAEKAEEDVLKETEVKPEEAEVKPEEAEVKPEEAEVKPEEAEVKPEEAEVKPEEAEVKPEEAEVKPEETEVKPEETEVKPEETEVKPEDEGK